MVNKRAEILPLFPGSGKRLSCGHMQRWRDPFKKIIKELYCMQATAQMYQHRIYTQGFRLTAAQKTVNRWILLVVLCTNVYMKKKLIRFYLEHLKEHNQ